MQRSDKKAAAILAAIAGIGLINSAARAGTYQTFNTSTDSTSAWSTVPVAVTATANPSAPIDLVQLQMANDSNYIYFQVTFNEADNPQTGAGLFLGIDSDNSASTGFNIYGSTQIGANAAFENDYPFTQSAGNFNSGGTLSSASATAAGTGLYLATHFNTATTTQQIAIPIDLYETDSSSGGYTGSVFPSTFTVEFYSTETPASVLGPFTYTIAAPVATYVLTGAGDFNSTASWSSGIPNGIGAEADFLGSITANHTVFADEPITVGKIVFDNTYTYVLAGAASLTMQTSSGSAVIDAQEGTQKITLPITIASDTVFQAESGATLVIGQPVTVDAGMTLSQAGAGTVEYQSTITVLSGGSLSLAASSYAHSLTLAGASSAALIAETGTTKTALELDTLSLASTSTLNLTNGDLIVTGVPLATINSQVASGFNATGAPWTGTGITSSTAANDSTHLTALGVIQNIAPNGSAIYSNFDGTSVNSSDVLVKYTYYGDSNLDGAVDGSDYTLIDNGFNNHLTGWYSGDYNYDGVVDGSDYTLIDNAYNTQGSSLGSNALDAQSTEQIAGISGPGSSPVPEPASLGVLIVGAAAGLGRRRRMVPHPRV
jgi:hypothetical protein